MGIAKWVPRPVEPNIFYYNVEPEDPGKLSTFVHNELVYFQDYVYKAIKSMDIEKYGLEWTKDERITYKLYPKSRITIEKPHKSILLRMPPDDFKATKPLMKSNQELLTHTLTGRTELGIIILVGDNEELTPGESIYYGLEPLKWEYLSRGFSGKIDYLTDKKGTKYSINNYKDNADFYVANLDCTLPSNIELAVKGVKITYTESKINTLRGVMLRDDDGPIGYEISPNNELNIITPRRITGKLRDKSGRQYEYKEESRTRDKDGVWIVLRESDDELNSADDDQRSKIDLFLELLQASPDFEVWEHKDVKLNDKSGRIKVKKIEREESRVLLEKAPSSKTIYPPKNFFQLYKQRNAIETLMFNPSPEHRRLLKLFEPYESVNWEPMTNEYPYNEIEWMFLNYSDVGDVETNRKATDEQRQFVFKSLNTPDFCLLEGPPGAGKTTAISELIYQLIKNRKRVLLSASTHVAIDNVLEKLEEKFSDTDGPKNNGIVPLRIGREENILDIIQKYQIDNRVEAMKKAVRSEGWFSQSPDEEKQYYLNELVIWSSNLVCGTMIGILQYPHFKEHRQGKNHSRRSYVEPEFDYLIIDEASKTTFAEFLVPAIYAKKWVIVGDVHQLSPYTDTLQVRVNLDGVMESQSKEKAQLVFLKLVFDRVNKKRRLPPPSFVYVDDKSVILELYDIIQGKITEDMKEPPEKRMLDDLKVAFISHDDDSFEDLVHVINEEELVDRQIDLMGYDLIFASDDIFSRKSRFFPISHILIYPENPDSAHVNEFRHNSWARCLGGKTYEYKLPLGKTVSDPIKITDEIYTAINKSWANELAWRMKRVYELQLAKNSERGSINYYKKSMHALMPTNREEHSKIWNRVKKIGQVALPSILTSMQEGVTQFYRNDNLKTALSHGFKLWGNEFEDSRHQKLSYQHRMHPQISKIPREVFYDNKALKDGLKEKDREWPTPAYTRYDKYRVVWLDVPNALVYKNTNDEEALKILAELDAFLKWAVKVEPPGARPWSIIILSFYERQRKRIRDLIRERYPDNSRKETQFIINGLKVFNYTVDKVQGREGDIVFLSMVQNERTGFMDSPNRLNVAVTRARYQLVIVGDRKYFATRQANSRELMEIAVRANPPLPKQDRRYRGS
jgi:hypothetical protein